jgi:exonuclease SbcC
LTQFRGIALPASVQQALQQKLERVEHELTQTGRQQQKNRKVSQWQNLRAKAQIITDLETHLIASTEADVATLNAAFLTPAELPKDAHALLQTRWQSVTDALENPSALSLQDQLPHNEEQLRLLCIRLEILADAETPKEDRELRMNYQVQKLAKGLGQSSKEPLLIAAQSLELEWHQTGPVVIDTRERLSRRFFSLMDQLIEKLQKN